MRDQTTASHNAFTGSIQNGSLKQENRGALRCGLAVRCEVHPTLLADEPLKALQQRALYIRRGELIQYVAACPALNTRSFSHGFRARLVPHLFPIRGQYQATPRHLTTHTKRPLMRDIARFSR
jgi:hypothetical protein